jgi:hypothetical protein
LLEHFENAPRQLFAAALCLMLSACSHGSEKSAPPPPADAGAVDRVVRDAHNLDEEPADSGRSYAPTYTAVWFEILVPNCANSFCHGGNDNSFILSTKEASYRSPTGLLDAPAGGSACAKSGLLHVDPGHPESSLLYLKLTDPPCGVRMPNLPGSLGRLDPRDIEQVRSWIELGARDD